MLNQPFHGFSSLRHVSVSEIVFNKTFITQISHFIFKSQNSFERRPVFAIIIIDMNKNFTSIANQKIGSQLSAGKIIIVNLLKIAAGTFDRNNRKDYNTMV